MSEEATGADLTEAPANAESAASEQPAATPEAGAPAETEASAPKKKRKQSTARKTRTVELTLTVTGTLEGEWQADLMHSGKRILQHLSIPASAVSKAAAELHTDISETIETVLHEARQQHETKLAELEAEVERVKKALAELES